MKSAIFKLSMLVLSMLLAACTMQGNRTTTASTTTTNQQGQTVAESTTTPAGGPSVSAGSAMDSIDRSKLSHALDKPIGKETTWENGNTGITYTVVTTRKTTMNGNPFCREYKTTATSGGSSKEYTGTACVATDGTWKQMG